MDVSEGESVGVSADAWGHMVSHMAPSEERRAREEAAARRAQPAVEEKLAGDALRLPLTAVRSLLPPRNGDELHEVFTRYDGELCAVWQGSESQLLTVEYIDGQEVLLDLACLADYAIDYILPLPDGCFLGVAARVDLEPAPAAKAGHSPDFTAGVVDDNAWVVDAAGRLLRAGSLGDALLRPVVSRGGLVWVTYFDEAPDRGCLGAHRRNDDGAWVAIPGSFVPEELVDECSDYGRYTAGYTRMTVFSSDLQVLGRHLGSDIREVCATHTDGESFWFVGYPDWNVEQWRAASPVRSRIVSGRGGAPLLTDGERLARFSGAGSERDSLFMAQPDDWYGEEGVGHEVEWIVTMPDGSALRGGFVRTYGGVLHYLDGLDWYWLRPFEGEEDAIRELDAADDLVIQAKQQRDQGLLVQALHTVRRGIDVYRSIAVAWPHRANRLLAEALDEESRLLVKMGDAAEALRVHEEAVGLARGVVASLEPASQAWLAAKERLSRLLLTSFDRLRWQGRLDEGADALQEAIDLVLAAGRDTITLARAKSHQSLYLRTLGDVTGAWRVACEALHLIRTLASSHAKSIELLVALPAAAYAAAEMGERAQAVEWAVEAVDIGGAMEGDPQLILDVAVAYSCLAQLGCPDDPNQTLRLADAHDRLVARAYNGRPAPPWWYAVSSGSRASAYQVLGDKEAEVAACQREEAFYELAARHMCEYRPRWAGAIYDHGSALRRAQRLDEAMAKFDAAEALFRLLSNDQAHRFRGKLAEALVARGELLVERGCHDEAVGVLREAAELLLQASRGDQTDSARFWSVLAALRRSMEAAGHGSDEIANVAETLDPNPPEQTSEFYAAVRQAGRTPQVQELVREIVTTIRAASSDQAGPGDGRDVDRRVAPCRCSPADPR